MSYSFQDSCGDDFSRLYGQAQPPSLAPIVRPNRNACLEGHGLERLYGGYKRLKSNCTFVAMAITDATLPSDRR